MKLTILHSNFEEIIKNIENPQQVVNIIAMKCNILNVPNLQFINLKALDLSFNNITIFTNIPAGLLVLNLSYNNIEKFNDLNLPDSLMSLNLQNNPISETKDYRSKTKKQLQNICPKIQYLDNVPMKQTIQQIVNNTKQFEKVMDFTYEMFAD